MIDTALAISVKHLTKVFRVRTEKSPLRALFSPKEREIYAVRDVSFDVRRGEAVAFLGPNGAGKTTTTKMLTGLMYPTSGEVSVLGFTPFDRKRDFLQRIGLVMGNRAGLNWDLTARQSFELFRRIYRVSIPDYERRLDELSEMLDVGGHLDTQVRRLSLGERMKVELIGSILHAPDVLFLDEPTIGLDVVAKKQLRIFLREMQRTMGVTLLLTSHDMDDVEEVCRRVIVIAKGQNVFDGSLPELTSTYQRHRYVRLTFAGGTPEILTLPHTETLERDASSVLLKVEADALMAFVADAMVRFKLLDLHIESVRLEAVIADLFRDRRAPPGAGPST